MMKKIIFTLIFGIATLLCYGQSFLSEYPKLTTRNLDEFFIDWESYSDSIASKATKYNDLIDSIQCIEYAPKMPQERPSRYFVLPQYIKVERYYMDVDTVAAKIDLGFPSFIPDLKDNQYTVDSITPILPQPDKTLYLTSDIYKVLSEYTGGLKRRKKTIKINESNIQELKKYIPVEYGHWGGYWWFTSFPAITEICYANNLIAVMRRTSYSTGDVIWYIKVNDKFVRLPVPVCEWVE
jgi:hypothetical protein